MESAGSVISVFCRGRTTAVNHFKEYLHTSTALDCKQQTLQHYWSGDLVTSAKQKQSNESQVYIIKLIK